MLDTASQSRPPPGHTVYVFPINDDISPAPNSHSVAFVSVSAHIFSFFSPFFSGGRVVVGGVLRLPYRLSLCLVFTRLIALCTRWGALFSRLPVYKIGLISHRGEEDEEESCCWDVFKPLFPTACHCLLCFRVFLFLSLCFCVGGVGRGGGGGGGGGCVLCCC